MLLARLLSLTLDYWNSKPQSSVSSYCVGGSDKAVGGKAGDGDGDTESTPARS